MSQGIQGRANHLFKGAEVKATRCVLWMLQRCWSPKHTGAGSWEIEPETEMKQDSVLERTGWVCEEGLWLWGVTCQFQCPWGSSR